jgi:hypothetical protein
MGLRPSAKVVPNKTSTGVGVGWWGYCEGWNRVINVSQSMNLLASWQVWNWCEIFTAQCSCPYWQFIRHGPPRYCSLFNGHKALECPAILTNTARNRTRIKAQTDFQTSLNCVSDHNLKLLSFQVMEESPSWDANRRSASQISRILWNSKVHCRVHRSPPLVPILNQMNPSNSVSLRRVIILPSHLRLVLPSGLFPSAIYLF